MDLLDAPRNVHFTETMEPSYSRSSTARADLPAPHRPHYRSHSTRGREILETSHGGGSTAKNNVLASNMNEETELEKEQKLAQLNLTDVLSSFASSITSAATLKVQAEATQIEKARHDEQRGRQRRHPAQFNNMTELVLQKGAQIRKITEAQERKRCLNKNAQNQTVKTLASKISPTNSKTTTSKNHDSVPATGVDGGTTKEVENLRSELKDVKVLLRDVRRENDHLEKNAVMRLELDKEIEELASKKALFAMETKTAENAVSVSKCRDKISNLQTIVAGNAEFSVEIGQLRDKLAKVATGLESKDGSDKQLQAEQSSLKVGLVDQDEKLKQLQTYVCGNADTEEKGLDTLIEDNSNQINVLKMGVEILEDRVNERSHESCGIRTDVQAASKELGRESETSFDVKKLEAKFETALSKGLKSIRDSQQSMVTDVTASMGELQARIDAQAEEISQLEARNTRRPDHTGLSLTPMHSTPDNALRSGDLDSIKIQQMTKELHQYKVELKALGIFVQSQQQKFDGLTTQELTQNMIGYMQQMYPFHPGNFLHELNDHTTSLSTQSATLGDLTARLQGVDQYLANHLESRLKSLEEGVTTFEKQSQALHAGHRDLKTDVLKKVDTVAKESNRLEGAVHDAEKARVDSMTTCEENIKNLDTKFSERLKQAENYAMIKTLDAQNDVDALKAAFMSSITQNFEDPGEDVPGLGKSANTFKTSTVNNSVDQEDADTRPYEIASSSTRGARPADSLGKKRKMAASSSDEEGDARKPPVKALQRNGRPTGGEEMLPKRSRGEPLRKNVSKGGYL